jgi:hypothetical protein
MKHRVLYSLLIILSSYATAQQCTTSVLVNAFDARTKTSLRGMRASDFSATAGRDPLRVESVRPVFRNRVLVLLDLSGQGPGPQRATVLQNIVDYINDGPQGMPVAFGVFAENAVFTNGFSSDPESLASSLHSTVQRATALGGHSHLAGALRQALAIFGQHRPGDTILLVSNGEGRTSRAQWNSLAREFSRRNVRLQLLMDTPGISGLEGSSFLSGFEAADHINPTLIKLANRTGGVLMGFMNSEWYNVAASGYLLDIRESQRTKSKNWHLRVRNYDDEFGVTPVLFYSRQLPGCSASLLASAGVN